MPLAEVVPLAEKADQHGDQKTIGYSGVGGLFHQTGVVGTTEQKSDASQHQHQHGPGYGLPLEPFGVQNELIDFLFVGSDVFGGVFKKFFQVSTLLEATIDVLGQTGDSDEVEHDEGLGKNSVDKGDQSKLDVLHGGGSGEPPQGDGGGSADGENHE